MARLPTDHGDLEQWGNILNTYLLVAHNADGTPKLSALLAVLDADTATGGYVWTADGAGGAVWLPSAGGGGGPSGAAGGILTGTYPDPGLAASVAGPGLGLTSDILHVNVDDSTLEVVSDTARVKAGGITSNELADTIANYRGPWSSGTAYIIGDIVSERDSLWMANAAGTNHRPPNASFWTPWMVAPADYIFVIERGAASYNATNINSTPHTVFLSTLDSSVPQAAGPTAGRGVFYLDPADFPSPSGTRTLRLRLTFQLLTNETSMGTVTLTAGLYPVTALATGGANAGPAITVGTVVTGSTVAHANPGTLAMLRSTAEIDFPTAGWYALGIANTAALAASSAGTVVCRLHRVWA